MANPEHLALLKDGIEQWNELRSKNEHIRPDLSQANLSEVNLGGANLYDANLREADLIQAKLRNADLREADLTQATLRGADLSGADLREANLREADLSGANLHEADLRQAYPRGANFSGAHLRRANLDEADLSGADLSGADLHRADLHGADLSGANLREANTGPFRGVVSEADLTQADLHGADLSGANLTQADLREADLSGANLTQADLSGANLREANLARAILISTNLDGADLSGASIFGISAWDLSLEGTTQKNLIIQRSPEETPLTVDDLEVAQFIYLLLNRRKLRNVITTLGEKAVLILGRFTERKELLDSIATRLRQLDYLPIIFDFERPTDRDLIETVKILAGLSRFVIADITNPHSVPFELGATMPDYMVPFVTILERGQPKFDMFDALPQKYHWALPLLEYNSAETLLAAFESKVVAPALKKLKQVRRQKARVPLRRSAED
jgi:uncharacterized protein YjbI with pentapeptide repeats